MAVVLLPLPTTYWNLSNSYGSRVFCVSGGETAPSNDTCRGKPL